MYGRGQGYRPRPPPPFGNDHRGPLQGGPSGGGPVPPQWGRGSPFPQGGQGPMGPGRGPLHGRDFGRAKICHNWRASGSCSYGDSCRYYHEPRPFANRGSEGLRNAMGPSGARHGGTQGSMSPAPGQTPPAMHAAPPLVPSTGPSSQAGSEVPSSSWGQHPGGAAALAAMEARRWEVAKESPYFKTKICEKFANGYCPYEDRCTFAHGMEEMRQFPRHIAQEPPGEGGIIGRVDPYMSASGRMPTMGPASGAGPPDLNAAAIPASKLQQSVASGPPPMPVQKVVDITMLDRVRAFCCLLGVGETSGMVSSKPGAMQAAAAAIKTGAAYRDNLYADSVESFIPQ